MPIISNFPGGSGTGGGGLALASATNIQTLTAHEKVYIKWTDPDDLVVAGSTLASWGGTLLVRKAGSMPTSRRDGVIILDSKTRDAYKTTYFCDSGLTNGTTYYYKLFPYTTANSYTDVEDDGFSATPQAVAPGNVSGKSAVANGNGKLLVKWTDPDATIVSDGITISTWASTKVVYKTGGYPQNPDDGTLAVNSTTRNVYATNGFTITGLTNGTTYYVSIFPISTDGAVNTNSTNRISGVPNRLVITAEPAQSGSLTYNGKAQNPSWSNYVTDKMVIGGETVGTNAKTYNATFTPKDDYVWSGDTEPKAKNKTWTIGKATGSLTLTPQSITLDKTKTSDTFTISGDFDGSYSVVSQNTGIATVALVSGKTYRVSSVNSTTGSTTIKVTCSGGSNYTAPSEKSVSVTAKFVTIYGAQWDGTSTTKWSRTDASASFTDPVPYVSGTSSYSSPFDNLAPWSEMKRVTDSVAGELVSIPKFYYKWTKSGNTLKLQIADGQTDGFYVSPAHADRGDGKGERDVVYVGRYHCAGGYTSKTAASPQTNITRSTARTQIHNLGTTIWQFDYAMRVTIQMLYLVEFADWDSQTKIGYGCGNNSAKQNTGASDTMPYHTGTMQSNRTTYGVGVQYRYIEGLWDNVYDWMDGCYYNSSGMNIIMNPNKFSDSGDGTLIGKPSNGWPSAIAVATATGLEWAIYPTATSGSGTTYVADSWYYSASYPCLFCGGSCGQDQSHGLFYVGYCSASYTSAGIGCRLQKLP